MRSKIVVIFFLIANFLTFSQDKNINNYKYIIVPQKFDFLKQNDQYKTSSLTKFLLEKKGFTVFLDSEEYPRELRDDRCMALEANVVNKSSMFKTKVAIEFTDCFNKLVYTSQEGESKIKDYKKSYQEAIRNSENTMKDVFYEDLPKSMIVQQHQKKSVASKVVLPFTVSKKTTLTSKKETSTQENTLHAQPIKNGFQLINSASVVVFLIRNTNVKDFYLIKDKNGMFYKSDRNWIAAFYQKDAFVEQIFQVKF